MSGGGSAVNYLFMLDLAKLSEDQLGILHRIGPTAQIASNTLDDEQYMRMQWFLKFGTDLDLEAPETFCEKIQWLKLRYRNPAWSRLADKRAVRDFVAERAGAEFLNTLHFAGDSLDGVARATLPESFIVKCTHGSGWNIVVSPETGVAWDDVVARVRYWTTINYADLWREWVYRDIPPGVIVERLLPPDTPWGLLDYKIFCFGGKARYIQVDLDRDTAHKRNLYDLEWRRLPMEIYHPGTPFEIDRPENLEAMIALAERLAEGLPFVRVDLFNHDGRILFGELTFFPGNGLTYFRPFAYDRIFGDHLTLPEPA